ncbi:MAG: ferredoxin--NADP reductase [Candidatus Binatia bacterium]
MAVERVARVAAIVDHAPDTRSLLLTLAEPLTFRPGQFLSCLLPVGAERIIRPYSIASDPEQPRELEVLLDRVPGGPGSSHLFGLRPGDALCFTGPWGTFTLDEAPPAETIFIAEGSGIAPVRPMIRRAVRTARHPLRLLYGTRLGIYREELEALPGVHVDVVPPERLPNEVLRRCVDADVNRSRHFFICGVGAIVHTLRDRLRGAGYARRAVQYEKW